MRVEPEVGIEARSPFRARVTQLLVVSAVIAKNPDRLACYG